MNKKKYYSYFHYCLHIHQQDISEKYEHSFIQVMLFAAKR